MSRDRVIEEPGPTMTAERQKAGLEAVLADEEAFSRWYERSAPRVFAYVFNRCGGATDVAEELTQQTFVEALRRRDGYDGSGNVVAWLCGIARHKLADHYRSEETGANTWFETDAVPIVDAYPLIGMEPGWIGRVPIASGGPLPWPSCPDGWRFGDAGEVAGRSADQVTCGPDAWWIDRESRLIVRHDADGRVVAEALRLTLGPGFSAERFLLDPPQGAQIVRGEEPGDATPWKGVLDVGQVPPTLEATYLDGTAFDSRTLRDRPTVLYFWGTWCPPCLDEVARSVVGEAADRGDSIRFVTVGLDSDRLLAEARDQVGALPIVIDETAESIKSWRLFAIPAFVLLDAEGRVAAVHVGVVDEAAFDRMLDALAAGEPVPTPSASQ